MKVPERNKLIDECIVELKVIHDKYFPRGKPLDDDSWGKCVSEMDAVAEKYQEQIPNISAKLCMALLDDIEEYHKKWIEYEKTK